MDLFDIFYRKYGIRKVGDIKSPRIVKLEDLSLPKNSVWHHHGTRDNPLPDPDHPLISEAKYVLTEHNYQVSHSNAKMIKRVKATTNMAAVFKGFHRDQQKIRLLRKDIASVRDAKTVILESYSLAGAFVTYRDHVMGDIAKNRDLLNAALAKIVELNKLGVERQHFITVELEETLPRYADVKNVLKKESREYLKHFSDYGNYVVMQLIAGMAKKGVFHEDLDSSQFDKINFIISSENRAVVVNLKKLIGFGIGQDQADDNKEIRAAFFRMMLVLTESDASTEYVEEEDDDDADGSNEDEPPVKEESVEDQLELRDNLLNDLQQDDIDLDDIEPYTPPADGGTSNYLRNLAVESNYSPAEIRRLEDKVAAQGNIKNPWGSGKLKDVLEIKPEHLEIDPKDIQYPDKDTVIDKGQLESSLEVFDKQYINEVMHRDIANVLVGFNSAGVILEDLEMEDKSDIASNLVTFKAKVTVAPGKSATIPFTLPKIDDYGRIWSGGVKYYMKKQFTDLPIRKIKSDRVALTSSMGKLFIDRIRHASYSYEKWLTKKLFVIVTDDQDDRITKANTAAVFDHKADLPNDVSVISKTFEQFRLKTPKGAANLKFSDVKKVKDKYHVGTLGSKDVLMDAQDRLHVDGDSIGTIPELLDLDMTKAPTGAAAVSIFGKGVPLAIVLGKRLGLKRLMRTLGVKPRVVKKGSSLNMQPNEYRVKFADQSWVFDKSDRIATMVMSSLNFYHRAVGQYEAKLFDKSEVYGAVMGDMGLQRRHVLEIDNIFDMFLDHITKGLLEEMKEPTDMVQLFIRSAELLTTHHYPDELDIEFMRFRGYERVAMVVYQEMVKAIRQHRMKGGSKALTMDFNPNAVWMEVFKDTSKEVFGEINPLHSLKQREGVTFGGTGGRDTQTMTKATRAFHPSHRGVISESSPDSGKVGIVAAMVPNPNFKSLRGRVTPYDEEKGDFNKLMSTSALLTPSSEQDDLKRVMFISVQNSHVIPAKGYKVPPMITGAEQVIGNRSDPLFATVAKQSGKVVKVNQKSIVVEYADGTRQIVELGKIYGKESGEVTVHSLVTNLKEGAKFKSGDTIAYNENWFTEDPELGLTLLFGTTAKIAFNEDINSFEDSVVFHKRLSDQLVSPGCEERNVFVDFTQEIHGLPKIGAKLDADSKLCQIMEAGLSDGTGLFDNDPKAMEILTAARTSSPTARKAGTVARIEVYYRGDKDEMSDGLLELIQFYEGRMAKDRRDLGLGKVTSAVGDTFRIEGKPLAVGQALFKIFIEYDKKCGLGDKTAFGGQMKCTVGRSLTGVYETTGSTLSGYRKEYDGMPVDGSFSFKSVGNRIVNSILIQGMSNTLCYALHDKALEVYLNGED